MNTDQKKTSLGIINAVIKSIISLLDENKIKDVESMLSINPHLWELDLTKENRSDIDIFKRLAHKILGRKETFPNDSEWPEFKRNVSDILKSI